MIEKNPTYVTLTVAEPDVVINVRRWSKVYVLVKGDSAGRPSIEVDRGAMMAGSIEWRHKVASLRRVTETKDLVVDTYGCDWVQIHLTRGAKADLVVATLDDVR